MSIISRSGNAEFKDLGWERERSAGTERCIAKSNYTLAMFQFNPFWLKIKIIRGSGNALGAVPIGFKPSYVGTSPSTAASKVHGREYTSY
jgi:hypothetical protein